MNVPLFEVEGVEAGYGDALVLHGVSLRADAGELAVQGAAVWVAMWGAW